MTYYVRLSRDVVLDSELMLLCRTVLKCALAVFGHEELGLVLMGIVDCVLLCWNMVTL